MGLEEWHYVGFKFERAGADPPQFPFENMYFVVLLGCFFGMHKVIKKLFIKIKINKIKSLNIFLITKKGKKLNLL